MLDQPEAQNKSDRRAMADELEKRTAAYHKDKRVMNDKWTAWAQDRQMEMTDAHKEAADESVHRINE